MNDTPIEQAANTLVVACHQPAAAAGWWRDLRTDEDQTCNYRTDVMLAGMRPPRNIAELLCLVHSEISEALEGVRKNQMDDKLPHRPALEVELADAVIRIFDMAGGLDLDLAGAIAEKLHYNAHRADHKLDARRADNGKAF